MSTLATLAGAQEDRGESKAPSSPRSTVTATPSAATAAHATSGAPIVDVIPYDARHDPNAHLYLPWLWRRLCDDGLVSLYFPGAEQTGFSAMVAMLSSDVTRVVLVVLKNSGGEVIDTIGFATWEPASMGHATMAHCGFIFLKDFWDRQTSVASARRIMALWFDEAKLDVMVGVVAKDNRLAMQFMQRVGWRRAGEIPYCHQYQGKQSDAVMWTITRQEFEALKVKEA